MTTAREALRHALTMWQMYADQRRRLGTSDRIASSTDPEDSEAELFREAQAILAQVDERPQRPLWREAPAVTSPRPWAAMTTGSEGCSIVARDVRAPRIARLASAPLETCQADAALIVEAVNAYDRLRRIEVAARRLARVLDLAGSAHTAERRTAKIEFYAALREQGS